MNAISRLIAAAATAAAVALPALAEPLPIHLIVLMPGEQKQVDAFIERLRQVPYLRNAKADTIGSPAVMIVSVAQTPTAGGSAASTTTGLLAASTLGLLPTVENKNITVHYELRSNYITVAAFDYADNFTSVSNLFGGYGKLPDDAREWITGTLDQLTADLAAHPGATALQAEYDTYFGKP